jgi:hypothetical protein
MYRKEITMKRVTVFETADELVDAFYNTDISYSVKLVADEFGPLQLVGEGADEFQIMDHIDLNMLIQAMARKTGVRLEMAYEEK